MKRALRLHILHPSHPVRRDPVGPTPPSQGEVVVQLIFHASTGILVVDGTGTYLGDGSLDMTTSPFTAPDTGTVVQIVVFGPGGPIVTEGTTGAVGDDGTLTIQ